MLHNNNIVSLVDIQLLKMLSPKNELSSHVTTSVTSDSMLPWEHNFTHCYPSSQFKFHDVAFALQIYTN